MESLTSASTPHSTLVEFMQVLVERRASSIEIRGKYWRASAMLHLSGAVCTTAYSSSVCFYPGLLQMSTSALVILQWLHIAQPSTHPAGNHHVTDWLVHFVLRRAQNSPFDCFQFFDMESLLPTTLIGVLVVLTRPGCKWSKMANNSASYPCKSWLIEVSWILQMWSPSENQPWWYFKKCRFEIFSYKNMAWHWYWALLLSSLIIGFYIANLLNHWWMNFMVFGCVFSNVNSLQRGLVVGRGGMRWGGRWQKILSWSSHDVHTMAHATLVGHRGSGEHFRSPPSNWHPPLVQLFQSWFWRVCKMPSRKAD